MVLERGVVAVVGVRSDKLALAVVSHGHHNVGLGGRVGPATCSALGLVDMEAVRARLGERDVPKGNGLGASIRNGAGGGGLVVGDGHAEIGEVKVRGQRELEGLARAMAHDLLGHLDGGVAGESDGLRGVAVGHDGVVVGDRRHLKLALAVIDHGDRNVARSSVVGPTAATLALLGDGEVVRAGRREGHVAKLEGLLGAIRKSTRGNRGTASSDCCLVGVRARLGQDEGEAGGCVVALDLLGHAKGGVIAKGRRRGAIGVGEGGRAACRGGQRAVAVIDNGDGHELARVCLGIVGYAVNTAGLGDAVVVDAGLGEGDVVKAGRGAIAVHIGHRGVLGQGRVGGLGRERKGVLTGDVTGTSKTAGYGKVLGDLDRSGCGRGAIGVGEGEVRALHGIVVLVDCLGDQVAALVGHLDPNRLGVGIVVHAVNATGLGDGVGVLTRRGIGNLIEGNGAAGVVLGGIDHVARGVLEFERELILDVSGAGEAVGFEHLAARDHQTRVICVVDVLERQPRGIAGILNLRAKRTVAVIGDHNGDLEGVLHGGHLGGQVLDVL